MLNYAACFSPDSVVLLQYNGTRPHTLSGEPISILFNPGIKHITKVHVPIYMQPLWLFLPATEQTAWLPGSYGH